MYKTPQLIQSDSLVQFRRVILPGFGTVSRDKPPEQLISFENLAADYQIPEAVLWDCLLALRFDPQQLNGQPHFTVSQVKRLEQFIKRVEIAWDCLKIF